MGDDESASDDDVAVVHESTILQTAARFGVSVRDAGDSTGWLIEKNGQRSHFPKESALPNGYTQYWVHEIEEAFAEIGEPIRIGFDPVCH